MGELRQDPLTGNRVLIAPERAERPIESAEPAPAREVSCPFCPGNESMTPPEILAYREGGEWRVRVVPNRYPAISPPEGAHEVIIESPHHHQSLAELPAGQIELVLRAVRERLAELRKSERLQYVSVYKNHGAAAGASLSHGHSQLIALPAVPIAIEEELARCRKHRESEGRCLVCDAAGEADRLILERRDFFALAPYASRFPYEMRLLPRRHEPFFERLLDSEMPGLAAILKECLLRLEALLDRPAYNIVLHSTPFRVAAPEACHWRLEVYPILSGIGGFERGTGTYINPTFPEEASRALREVQWNEASV